MMYDEQNLQELSDQCIKFLRDSAKLPQLATLFNRFLNGFGSVYNVRFDGSYKLIPSADGPGTISQLSEDTHREINDICQILVESASGGLNDHRNSVALLNTLLSNFLRCFSFNDRSITVNLSPERTVSVSVNSAGSRIVPLAASSSRTVPSTGPNGLQLSGKNGPGLLLGPGLGVQLGNAGNSGLRSGSVSENLRGLLESVLENAMKSESVSKNLQGLLEGVLKNAWNSGLWSGSVNMGVLREQNLAGVLRGRNLGVLSDDVEFKNLLGEYKAAELALTTAKDDNKNLLNESVHYFASIYLLIFLTWWIPGNHGTVVPYNVLRDFIIQEIPWLKLENITPVLILRIVEAMPSLFLLFGGDDSYIICNANGDLTINGFNTLKDQKIASNSCTTSKHLKSETLGNE